MRNYRKIWQEANGDIPIDENGMSYEIHHIDGNHNNNSLDNLKLVSIQEHYDIHFAQGDILACALISKRASGHNSELKQAIAEYNKENNSQKNKARSKKQREKILPAVQAYINSDKTIKQIASEFNCSSNLLRVVLAEQGLTRNKGYYMSSSFENALNYKKELIDTRHLSCKEASHIIGISSNSVAVYRRKLGI
jgi:AraC-like DNA-binding protein